MGFQRALVEASRIEGLGGGEGLGAILERMACVDERLGDRAAATPRAVSSSRWPPSTSALATAR